MSNEAEKQLTTIENLVQEHLVETIKSSKREHDLLQQGSISSKPKIIQDNTEIIEKIDAKIQSYLQLYSDLYKKYLHNASNFYNASYLVQREFLGKIGVDDSKLGMFDTYLGLVKQMVLSQIDLNENMTRSYVGLRLEVLDIYDKMASRNIFNLAKMFSLPSDFNK
jgi:hypothetical protein